MPQLATDKPRTTKKEVKKPIGNSPTGQVPPSAPEIEDAVIGALMVEQDAYSRIADILKGDCFYKPTNQIIFNAISALGNRNEPIDMLTVMEELKQTGKLEAAGGVAKLSELTGNVSTTTRLTYYANIIAQKALSRDLIRVAYDTLDRAYNEEEDVESVMNSSESQIFQLSQRSQKRTVTQIDPVIKEAFKRMRTAGERSDSTSGVPSGFVELDKITSGWQKSDLIIIAARPAMGKTAFVLSMAKNMAVNYRRPVALFSLEMSNVQLVNRLIMNVCEIEGDKIRNGRITAAEWAELDRRITELEGAPIYIDDTPSLSVFELRSKARQLVHEQGVECIIIDYLQLMNASGMQYGSREQEVSTISRNLKALAKELDIPIIALSQLNRSVESRGADKNSNQVDSKRPQLSDLRESGAIEQDADMVCFIHRPEYYKIYTDSEGNSTQGKALIIVAKHRNGATADVTLRFAQTYAKFENLDVLSAAQNDEFAPKQEVVTYTSKVGAHMASMNVDDNGDTPF